MLIAQKAIINLGREVETMQHIPRICFVHIPNKVDTQPPKNCHDADA